MPTARLTHDSRPTLAFRQAQRDADTQEAVANVAAELGTDRPPLVHVETRERQRSITGRVTAPRRAENDPDTGDWRQALANYADRLESHVDEYQGTGYTLEDDVRDESLNAVYHSLEWTLSPGVPHEIEFTCEIEVGRGTFETAGIDRRNPTVDTSMDVAARVDGEDLPGMRELVVSRSLGYETNAIFNRSSAENNDVIINEGPRHEVTFRGTHTGTDAERRAADDALDALIGEQTTLETRFPGYDLSGFVLGYDSNLEQRFGESSHHYSLRFIEGQRA